MPRLQEINSRDIGGSKMSVALATLAGLFLGLILGFIFGFNAANTKQIVETTTVRHTKEYNRALREIQMQLAALPEELVDSVREAFPQLYDGPKER